MGYLVLGFWLGKSTLCQKLIGTIKNCLLIDADLFWRAEFDQPANDFSEFKNFCLKVANAIGQNEFPILYFLQGTPQNFEQSPEHRFFSTIHYLFLVCDNDQLEHRLQNRPPSRKIENLHPIMKYNDWLKRYSLTSEIPVIDTSRETIESSVNQIRDWIRLRIF